MRLDTPQAGPGSCMVLVMKKRVDLLLTELGLCPSRTKAKELIEKGLVRLRTSDGISQINSPSQAVDPATAELEICDSDFLKYVARSGHKLEGALQEVSLHVNGFTCLDVGASTGGFTDCLLQKGAEAVTCIDVGRDQLHPKIAADARVTNIEGVNAKDLDGVAEVTAASFDLAVIDVSFISAAKVLAPVLEKLKNDSHLLSLIKPQFEVGSVNIGKRGIVKSEKAVQDVLQSYQDWSSRFQHHRLRLSQCKIFPSALKGRDGNQEYFLYVRFTSKENS